MKTWQASPILGVESVRAAAEYYRDVLGFRLDPVDGVFQPSADEPGGVYAIFERPGAWIHFQIRRGAMPKRERQAFERDVYIYVDDLDALHSALERPGAVILQAPRRALHGIREMDVEDSSGYRLAFGQIA